MGYRSNIVIIVKNEHLENSPIYAACPDTTLTNTHYTLFHWDWTKWYDTYKDVASVMEFIQELPEEDYEFFRLGEEPGDITHEGAATEEENCHFYINHYESIDYGITEFPNLLPDIETLKTVDEMLKSLEKNPKSLVWVRLCEAVDNYRKQSITESTLIA